MSIRTIRMQDCSSITAISQNSEQITNIMYNIRPDEVYHLGAQSHVRVSFETPEYTGNVTALGTTRLLELSEGAIAT